MTQASRPVVLATGGTGGHVFPAEALAGELEARGVPFTLVTDSRGRQWQGALSRRPIHYIHSASPTGSPVKKALALFSLALGLFDAWRALGRIGPSVVVGFGGYASVPTMVAARLRRLPAMLHEQKIPWKHIVISGWVLDPDRKKMSKSKGGTLTLSRLKEEGFDPMHYRYFLLNAHYRKKLNFSEEGLQGAKNAYEKLRERIYFK